MALKLFNTLAQKYASQRAIILGKKGIYKFVPLFPSFAAFAILTKDGKTRLLDSLSFNSLGQFAGIVESLVTTVVPLTGATILANIIKKHETIYINPAGTLAALTVTLPDSAHARVGQSINLWFGQVITSLTINTTGTGTLVGTAVTAATQYQSITYQCVSVSGTGTWIRK